jgi:MFS family permease
MSLNTIAGADAGAPRAATNLARQLSSAGVAVLLVCAFLPLADFFIVNVALPSIDHTLRASGSTLELIVAGYGTAYASLLVLGGRLGDRLGRRRALVMGLFGFIVASLACGLAPDVGLLVAARVAQGIAAALMVPQVLATFHSTLTDHRRVRALALYGATAGLAAVLGQLAGGLLVTADILGTGWRPIFLVNIPVGLVVLAAIFRAVPETRSINPAHVDVPGTVLFSATLTALLVVLTAGPATGWPLWTWSLLAAALALGYTTGVVEVRAERRGEVPLLPPSLLRRPSMRRGLAIVLPFAGGFGAFMFVFALTIQQGLGEDALHSALAILPMAVMFLVGSLVSPRIIGRYGRGALAFGAALQMTGLGLLVLVTATQWPDVRLWELAVPLAVAGAGQSLIFTGLFRIVLVDCPPHHAGVGGGVLVTVQQSGIALGVATIGGVYLALATSSVPHAFAVAVAIQIAVVAALAAAIRTLPRFAEADRG